jgi:DNA mismatch endonuclease (patch repair protein)
MATAFILTSVADVYDPDTRSRVMARVRGRDTRPEIQLRQSLYVIGVRGWRCNRRGLPGTPDLAFGKRRLAVFVDGGWWHGHPRRYTPGKSGPYWDAKIQRTMARDRENEAALAAAGWSVLRLWDFEILSDPMDAARRVAVALGGGADSG